MIKATLLVFFTNFIQVVTGDRRGAGTNATVSIVLYGEGFFFLSLSLILIAYLVTGTNSGPPKVLQSSANNFERGT